MYSIKQEYTFKSHKTISNNMHYRMIRDFSVNLSVVTVVITLMLMPPHIFASDRAWAAEWNGNSGQFTPVQEAANIASVFAVCAISSRVLDTFASLQAA
jgi:hypothetical protein